MAKSEAKRIELSVDATPSGEVIPLPNGMARIIVNTAVTVDGEYFGFGTFDQVYDPSVHKTVQPNRAQRRKKG